MILDEALAKLAALLVVPKAVPLQVMLAGSNGAGKSTFYDAYLASLPIPFVNADRIAADLRTGDRVRPPKLSGLPADEAARQLADEERQAYTVLRRSFVTETVLPSYWTIRRFMKKLSDPVGARVAMLKAAREQGFEVWLFFIGISSPALSSARVWERVSSRAGHDVPPDRIQARYPRTLANLPGAVAAVSHAVLLDNDLPQAPYRFVAWFENGRLVRASDLVPSWARAVLPAGPSGFRGSR